MALIRRTLFDTAGRKHVRITHDTVVHEVWIETFGPAGGIHGTIRVSEQTAADCFRDIIGSVKSISRRPLGGDVGMNLMYQLEGETAPGSFAPLEGFLGEPFPAEDDCTDPDYRMTPEGVATERVTRAIAFLRSFNVRTYRTVRARRSDGQIIGPRVV